MVTSLRRPFFVPADIPYIGSCLNLSTTATATKACPQVPKYPPNNGQLFHQRLMKKARIFIKIDPYGRITACNRILIVFHLYCRSKHKFSTILIANTEKPCSFCLFFGDFYLYNWVTIMGYSKHKIITINMLFFLKKIRHITHLPPHNGHLLPSPRWPLWRSSTVPYLKFFFPKDHNSGLHLNHAVHTWWKCALDLH